ncbi:hypothetical protein [Arthrobacter terricola]|uniref:Uncharacterized protein n=2 Tax=Arthrobacter TaxID=1663 RepID=A0A4R5L1E0_9MICC|nr:hypothetical protein [Arthrobacter terricola]MBT8159539.1 hypothetical protein [Arthrobacter sp. GN70]TDG01336.1 hypothetical protein E1809_02160 [Arthrobacter terricola]
MAAYASKLSRFFSIGGYGSDSTYRGEPTRMALRRADRPPWAGADHVITPLTEGLALEGMEVTG